MPIIIPDTAPKDQEDSKIWAGVHDDGGATKFAALRGAVGTTLNGIKTVALEVYDASLNFTIGTRGDGVATDDGGSWSVVAILKRIATHLSGIRSDANTNATTASGHLANIGSGNDVYQADHAATNSTAIGYIKGALFWLSGVRDVLGSRVDVVATANTGDWTLSSMLKRVSQHGDDLKQQIVTMLALVGAMNEAAPATDTANSGVNGRLQRIAQRLSTLITTLAPLGTSSDAAATNSAIGSLIARVGGVMERVGGLSDAAWSGVGNASLNSLGKALWGQVVARTGRQSYTSSVSVTPARDVSFPTRPTYRVDLLNKAGATVIVPENERGTELVSAGGLDTTDIKNGGANLTAANFELRLAGTSGSSRTLTVPMQNFRDAAIEIEVVVPFTSDGTTAVELQLGLYQAIADRTLRAGQIGALTIPATAVAGDRFTVSASAGGVGAADSSTGAATNLSHHIVPALWDATRYLLIRCQTSAGNNGGSGTGEIAVSVMRRA